METLYYITSIFLWLLMGFVVVVFDEIREERILGRLFFDPKEDNHYISRYDAGMYVVCGGITLFAYVIYVWFLEDDL